MSAKEDPPAGRKPLPDEIARNVRQARGTRGLSVADLAQKSGLSREFIEALEKGQIDMTSQTALLELDRAATALGVECAALLERHG